MPSRSWMAIAAVLAAIVATGCAGGEPSAADRPVRASGAAANPASPSPAASGGWVVEVSVAPARIGLLAVHVDDASAGGRGWRVNRVTLENVSKRPVAVTHGRRSILVRRGGDPVLLVADEGCGYVPGNPPRAGACTRNLDSFTLDAAETASRRITLLKGLRGMSPLRPGQYVFHKTITIEERDGPRDHELRITYTIRRA